MHIPHIYSLSILLYLLLSTSRAIPVARSLSAPHSTRALISSQGSGPLRYGSWKIIYQSVSLAVTTAADGTHPVVQSFGQLWSKVQFIADGFRGVSEDMVPARNHMMFRTTHVELLITSAERILWDDIATYADALVALVGKEAKFWEGWGVNEKTGQYIYTVLKLRDG